MRQWDIIKRKQNETKQTEINNVAIKKRWVDGQFTYIRLQHCVRTKYPLKNDQVLSRDRGFNYQTVC